MGFKVGDRVRIADCYQGDDLGLRGRLATVTRGQDARTYMKARPDDSSAELLFHSSELELLPYKLEKGATVTIGDGQDEWIVTAVFGWSRTNLVRNDVALLGVDIADLRVVKPAPDPLGVGALVRIDSGKDVWRVLQVNGAMREIHFGPIIVSLHHSNLVPVNE